MRESQKGKLKTGDFKLYYLLTTLSKSLVEKKAKLLPKRRLKDCLKTPLIHAFSVPYKTWLCSWVEIPNFCFSLVTTEYLTLRTYQTENCSDNLTVTV